MKKYIVFYVNKSGLRDFVIIDAIDFKDATIVSKSFSKATKCEILGVCADCFKSFKLDNNE
jgi:hypothetical protein|nr:MAG TPA: hypothetical protein [Microviridae sp.]